MFRRKVTTILPHHQIKAQKKSESSTKCVTVTVVTVQNTIGEKVKRNLIFIYINIKLFFEFWMVPKTTVTTVTVTLEKNF